MTGTKAVTRSDRDGARIWVVGALDMIAASGVQSVRIEPLAREVGVSKGSFYWFFRDLDDLKQQALIYWRDALNAPVFAEIRAFDAPLPDRLSYLVDRVLSGRLGRYDGAIRGWALVDKRTLSFVQEVDKTRLGFLEEVFASASPVPAENRMRAHLFYRAFIAESYVRAYPGAHSRADFLRDVAAFLSTGFEAEPSAH